ncbi:Gas vesicle structural protein [Labilithrix luteola]|uniref:Gas vesicle structural protein n=1 Tax=Labilithrix luteola TaxID=1391654 RepID=A0A0K1PNM2_9BACT|nr:gas vesicle structural protein GvpA [Labilithrix luteola]AKU94996.1 Gas vesicle structural protein [Labilithrix luteola]
MNVSASAGGGGGVTRSNPGGGTLADILDRVLDKGIVIEAWATVSLLGIEILGVKAQVVVASVETYLKYANLIAGGGQAAQASSAPEIKSSEAPSREPAAKAPALTEKPQPSHRLPSEDELVKYLTEHSHGLGLDQMGEHFHVPPEQLEAAVVHLVEEHRVRKDEARKLFLPVGGRKV